MDTLVKYNFSSKEEISSRNSVPILAWDFHYESVNELKAVNEDLKKLDEFSSKFRWNTERFNIKQRISQEVVIITDVEQTIVFASNGILNMTGYSKEEVVGQKPKMFQGSSTSPTVRKEIRKAIELSVPFDKTVINHKKNGSTYKCKINCFPIFNIKGQLSHYIAFERAA